MIKFKELGLREAMQVLINQVEKVFYFIFLLVSIYCSVPGMLHCIIRPMVSLL